MKITTIGIDLAKNVFQVHCVDGHGKVLLKKLLKRDQMLPSLPCLAWHGSLWQRPLLAQQVARVGAYRQVDGSPIR